MSFIGLVSRSIGSQSKLASFRHASNSYTRLNINCHQRTQLGLRALHQKSIPATSKDTLQSLAEPKKSPALDQTRQFHAVLELDHSPGAFRVSAATRAELVASLKVQWQKYKDFFDGKAYPEAPPHKKKHGWVLWTFLGVNGTVWASFIYGLTDKISKDDARYYNSMTDNFCVSLKTLREGRVWTLITSSVAQQAYDHLLMNMAVLYYIAPPLVAFLGPGRFITMYFGAAVLSNLSSICLRSFQRKFVYPDESGIIGLQRQPLTEELCLGASGSLFACITTFIFCAPHSRLMLFSWIPTPVWIPAAYILTISAYEFWDYPTARTDHGAHWGGALTGFLFWRFGLRGVRYRSLVK